ncbi:uncharacterized protein LOC106170357 [Lingula anatina]|uniref:Uncharacterized protein LOC106170357 n=1 Tax=Lingula anatina TaxID=7574 RepID=A0A1S3J5Y1_LINAN|nr:uncharacterized protein LOC106170357 [Lingula anatina]|eukprot:XP_013405656.1 uncharacterized protein LOC106170357 [Lingula anatina]
MVVPALSCIYACMLFNPDISTPSEFLGIQKCLQDFIGPSPIVQLESFTNWEKLVSYDHVFVAKPKSAEEVQRTVRAALQCRRQVRGVGSAHSSEPIWADRGHINLNITQLILDEGKRIILHPEGTQALDGTVRPFSSVTVAAGVTQGELISELEKQGYAFPPGPLIYDTTIGGAIATASHNAISNAPSIGGFMTRARLVDGWGDVREFSQDTDIDIMRALRCNLGLLGILFEIELRVVPQEDVIIRNVFTPMRNLFNPDFIRDTVLDNYLTFAMYAPYNSLTAEEAKVISVTGKVPQSWNSANDLVMLKLIKPASGSVEFTVDDERPQYLPNITKVSVSQDAFKIQLTFPAHAELPLTQAIQVPASFISLAKTIEYTVNDPTFAAGAKALRVLSSYLNEASYRNGVQAMEEGIFKWFKGTDCLICPGSVPLGWSKQKQTVDHSYFSSFHVHRRPGPPDHVRQTNRFQSEIVTAWDQNGLNGLPHWGKGFLHFPSLKQRIRRGYGFDLTIFKIIRQTLDPLGVFTDDLLRRVFDIYSYSFFG